MTLPNAVVDLPGRRLGVVVAGQLSRGIQVRLDGDAAGASVEDVAVGSLVTIRGRRQRFFGVITDVELRVSDDNLRHFPPAAGDAFITEVMGGTAAYGLMSVMPGMAAPADDNIGHIPESATTIPEHFSPAFTASQADVDAVFNAAPDAAMTLGSPQAMDGATVRLDLRTLASRSLGVFGASGTGKTFLARMLLAGQIRLGETVSLVFDMQNEYGWQGQDNDRRQQVKGLKQLFPSRVATFTLDADSSQRRGSPTDGIVRIGYDEIEPGDISALRELLNLSEVAAAAAYNLERHYGRSQWLQAFVSLNGAAVGELASEIGVNLMALQTLHRRLSAWSRFGFLAEQGQGSGTAGGIIEQLERGNNVVLEFGKYGSDTAAYVLVSNLLTRRIHETWVRRKESADGGQGDEPRPLVIFIEEAHKFLTPEIAAQTIFGTIARELRKYNVTLMIVDQRPSGIDSEVMSQLGTRLVCHLNDDRDLTAALMGARDSGQLREVAARLGSKQQALLFGHAAPMPLVFRPRDYDAAFYADLALPAGAASISVSALTSQSGFITAATVAETDAERMQREIDELFPPE